MAGLNPRDTLSNADAGVDYLKHSPIASFLQRETDTSWSGSVLDRVVEQNIQQLLQRGLVAGYF
jgi:hypothetical protein